jgi:hypothetical protein
VRYAVDRRPDAEVRPVGVQAVPAVPASEERLAGGCWKSSRASKKLEPLLRQGLDAAGGVADRLDDERPVVTPLHDVLLGSVALFTPTI